jgi:N6-L-threonylcarbamoyladenine synthase
MLVLGIDTSCDDTSVSVIENYKIIVNLIASQQIHKQYQGIVPELASREHLVQLQKLYYQALKESNLTINDLDLIAVTIGPGLIGPLMVGLGFAKGLCLATGKPIMGVHHLEGHLFASYLDNTPPEPPFIALIASGGHTALYDIEHRGQYKMIGATRDDAAGEAFDKASIIMGLGYPGGPMIEKIASAIIPKSPQFPIGLQNSLEFSFSGLKTSVSLYIKSLSAAEIEKQKPEIAAALQHAISVALATKTISACKTYNRDRILIAGGVISNSYLREMFTRDCERQRLELTIAPRSLATDNGAMIAAAGLWHYQNGKRDDLTIAPFARMPLELFSQTVQ